MRARREPLTTPREAAAVRRPLPAPTAPQEGAPMTARAMVSAGLGNCASARQAGRARRVQRLRRRLPSWAVRRGRRQWSCGRLGRVRRRPWDGVPVRRRLARRFVRPERLPRALRCLRRLRVGRYLHLRPWLEGRLCDVPLCEKNCSFPNSQCVEQFGKHVCACNAPYQHPFASTKTAC